MQPVIDRQERFSRGMNSQASPTEYLADELSHLANGELSIDGSEISVRAGSRRTHPTALSSGAQAYGAIEFHKADGTQQLVVFAGSSMHYSEDQGATWTEGATGLDTAYWDLAIMRVGAANKLLCVNGGSSVYSWDGDAWAALSNPPSGIRFVAVFNGRAYYAGHDGIAVIGSGVGDPDDMTLPSAFEVQVQTHDGDSELTGIYALGSVLLVFKRNSTNYIDGFGYQTLSVQAGPRGVSRSVGCLAFRTIRAVSDQAVCWLSERGIEFYRLGGLIEWVSRPIQPLIDELAWSNIVASDGIAHAAYIPQRHEYRCAVPTSGSVTDLTIVFRPPTETVPPAIWLRSQLSTAEAAQTVYVDTDGYLRFSDTPDREKIAIVGGYLVVGGPAANTYVELTT